MATTVTRYVNTASTPGTQDGTTSSAGNSGTAAFETLQAAITALKTTYGDLVGDDQILRIVCYGTTVADTTPASILAADWTTDATRYVEVVPGRPPMGVYRGLGGNTSYGMEVGTTEGAITISADYTRVSGISILANGDVSGAGRGFTVSSHATIQRCFIRNAYDSGASGLLQAIDANLTAGQTLVVANCYFYGWARTAIQATDGCIHCGTAGTLVLYNNTMVNSERGIFSPHAGVLAKNCAAECSTGFATGTYMTGTTCLATANITSPPGTNGRASLNFVWHPNNDVNAHLVETSELLIGWGAQLHHDTTFPLSDDIDGRRRDGPWDVGCDQRSPWVVDDQSTFTISG